MGKCDDHEFPGNTRYTSLYGKLATRSDLTTGMLAQPGQTAPDSGHSKTVSTTTSTAASNRSPSPAPRSSYQDTSARSSARASGW